MSNTKSNPYTLIAGFLLPWKVTKNSTRKEQPNNNKKPCACGYCLCSNASKTPRGLPLCQGKFWQKNKNSKSQKVFDFSTFRFFWFFWLFDFSTFRLFELFELFEFFDFSSRNLLECELFDFSTFRLFAVKNRDFHGVTATSQKSTQNGGTPIAGWFIMEHPFKMDGQLGVTTVLWETSMNHMVVS